jgi:hypothetical protein
MEKGKDMSCRKVNTMDTERILIVSERPLLCEGLKKIIEEAMPAALVTISGERGVKHIITEFAPGIILIDRPSAEATSLDHIFGQVEYPVKVIVIGFNDDQILVYSQGRRQAASFENLIMALSENGDEQTRLNISAPYNFGRG